MHPPPPYFEFQKLGKPVVTEKKKKRKEQVYITYNYTIYLFDLYFPKLFNARPPSLYVFSTPTHF